MPLATSQTVLIPEAASEVSVADDLTTIIPVPSSKGQNFSSSNEGEARLQNGVQLSELVPLPGESEVTTQVTSEGVNESQSPSHTGPAHGEDTSTPDNDVPHNEHEVDDQGASADTSHIPIEAQELRHIDDHGTQPAAKRRRVEFDNQARPVFEASASVAAGSGPIPTTETEDQAAPTASIEVPQTQPTASTKKRKSVKARGKQRLEEAAATIVADATNTSKKKKKGGGRPGRRRQLTPEGAEGVKIAPSVVKMADLCKDLRTGKKSKREIELQGMDLKEAERKQEERRILREGGQLDPPAPVEVPVDRLEGEDAYLPQHGHLVPQTRIRNGIIELDPDSLILDRHAHAAQNSVQLEIREENTLSRRVTSGTWLKREKKEVWNEEVTDRFYQGLRMFGTDFEMISKLFPGRSRRSIKLKFCKEEKLNNERIRETLLGPRESVDIARFSELTNTEYKDPKEFEMELREDRRNLEEQQAREKEAHDELVRQKEAEVAAEGAAAGGNSSAKENEAQGGEPLSTKGPRGRKANAKTKHGRPKKVVGGVVEVLGTVD